MVIEFDSATPLGDFPTQGPMVPSGNASNQQIALPPFENEFPTQAPETPHPTRNQNEAETNQINNLLKENDTGAFPKGTETVEDGILAISSRGLPPKKPPSSTTDSDIPSDEWETVHPGQISTRFDSKNQVPADPFRTLDPGGNPLDSEGNQSGQMENPDCYATKPQSNNSGTQKYSNGQKEGWNTGKSVQTIGGYEIIKELGRGGMGVVYQARHPKLNRVVALKMILSGSNAGSQDLNRFLVEAEAIARLQHPNIIQLYEFGEYQGQPYFTLEFVSGGSLADLVREQPLPPRKAAQLAYQIAKGMAFAHENGIIHRDLKPANILIQEKPLGSLSTQKDHQKSDYEVKITDFGLAKKVETDSELTGTNAIMGSPCYMAPEQARGDTREIDQNSDVYGIGAILYQLVTGRPPFQAARVMDVLRQVIEKDPVKPSLLGIKMDLDLETICLKCLEKDKSRRYPTALLLSDDLSRYLNGEPILARPPGNIEKIVKWAKRKPLKAALGLLSGVTLTILFAFLATYIRYQYDLAEQKALNLQNDLDNLTKRNEARKNVASSLLSADRHIAASDWGLAESELRKSEELIALQGDIGSGEQFEEIEEKKRKIADGKSNDLNKSVTKSNFEEEIKRYDKTISDYLYFGVFGKQKLSLNQSVFVNGDNTVDIQMLLFSRMYLSAKQFDKLIACVYELEFVNFLINKGTPDLNGNFKTIKDNEKNLNENFKIRSRRFFELLSGESGLGGEPAGGADSSVTGKLDWFLLALERFQRQDYLGTEKACNEILELEKDNFWAAYIKGLSLLRQATRFGGESKSFYLQGARAAFSLANALDPAFPWALIYRGSSTSSIAFEFTSAVGSFRGGKVDPGLIERECQSALKDFDKVVLTVKGLPLAVCLNERAQHFIRVGDYSRALVDAAKAIQVAQEVHLDNVLIANLHSIQSVCQWKLGKKMESLAEIEKALEIIHDNPQWVLQKAEIFADLKETKRAKDLLSQLLELENVKKDSATHSAAYFLLARIQLSEKDFAGALKSFEISFSKNPGSSFTEIFKFETLLKLKKYQLASESIDRLIKNDIKKEGNFRNIKLSGMLHEQRGQFDQAAEMYGLFLKMGSPTSREESEILARRGWCEVYLKGYQSARKDFSQAVLKDDLNHSAKLGKALSAALMGDHELAFQEAGLLEKELPNYEIREYLFFYRMSAIYSICSDGFLEQVKRKKLVPQRGAYDLVSEARLKAVASLKKTLALAAKEEERKDIFKKIEKDSAFAALRSYPPFQALMETSSSRREK